MNKDLSVSVLKKGSEKTFVPFYITQKTNTTHTVLFVYYGRFYFVRNLSRLFGEKGKRKKKICEICFEKKCSHLESIEKHFNKLNKERQINLEKKYANYEKYENKK